MSITAPNLSRTGQVNATGVDDALFLKQFGGEVLTAFHAATVFMDKHFVREIRNGKTAQFPMVGTAGASYHTPGNFIEGQNIKLAEKTVTIDGVLQSSFELAEIDELETHFDVRSKKSAELGDALAQVFDGNVARCIALSARASNAITGRPGGSRIVDAAIHTDMAKLTAALFTGAQTLDEKNVTGSTRYAAFRPAQFYLLAQNKDLLYREIGGTGSISSGTLESAAGLTIVKSNNIPNVDDSANAALHTKYRANYAATKGLIFTPDAAATLKLMDVTMASEWSERYQTNFFIAKMAVGHDFLRPECAIELATA